MKFIGLFSVIAIFIIGGIYFGFLEFNGNENFFGRISGIDSGDDFEFVGEINLNKDSVNQNTNQKTNQNTNQKNNNQNIAVKSAKQNKKTPSLNENVVKVVSGAAAIATTSTTSSASSISIVENNIIQISSTSIQEQKQEQEQIIIPVVASTTFIAPIIQPSIANHILVSEIMVGVDGNADYEFIEIFNPTANPVDLTGWSIKKKSSTNSESTLVSSSRLKGKIILSNKYFLLANEGGYDGSIVPDVFWPKSYTLAYSNNAIIIYNANSELIEEVSWTEIPKGQSIERESFSGNQFKIQPAPNPQNSNSN